LRNLEIKRLGQSIGKLELLVREYDAKPGLTFKEFLANKFIIVEEIPVEAINSEYEKKYCEIHDEIIQNKFPHLKKLYDKATGMQAGIQLALQEILLRRDYIRYTCSLCYIKLA
jgi:hypothetical protein